MVLLCCVAAAAHDLEREYGPLGDYQEAVVQQEGARRAAWLPTDGAAGAAAGDATATLGAVEATGEAAGAASVNGAAQAAHVAGVQAAAPAASGLAVTPGAFAFSPMALAPTVQLLRQVVERSLATYLYWLLAMFAFNQVPEILKFDPTWERLFFQSQLVLVMCVLN